MPKGKGKKRKPAAKKKEDVNPSELPSPCIPAAGLSSSVFHVQEDDQLSNEACALPVVGIHNEATMKKTNLFEFERQMPLVLELPRKPEEPGKMGRLIKLISNCFPLEFPQISVYHYDIEIRPKGSNYPAEENSSSTQDSDRKRKKYRCLNTKLNREIFRIMQRDNADFTDMVFDGKRNLFSIQSLTVNEESNVYEISLDSKIPGARDDPRGPRKDIFEVEVKPVKKETGDCIVSLEPLHALFKGKVASVSQEAVMVLETVLRHTPCLRYVPVARSFYYPPSPNEFHPLGGGKEIWFGYHQSVLLGQKQAMVNLDISSTAFYENISVIDYVAKYLNKNVRDLHNISALNRNDIQNLNKDLKNVQVEVTHLPYPRKYFVREVSTENANDIKFEIKEGHQTRVTTIRNYFLQRYRIRLRYPHLPCLSVGADVFLPFEVCTIVEKQHCRSELNGRQLTEMIKVTAIHPKQRFLETLEVYKNSDYDNDPFLRAFDIEVLPDPLKLNGRVLGAPQVKYSNEIVRPINGLWNMRNIKFFYGTEINSWTLLSFANPADCPERLLEEFAKSLQKYANLQGIKLKRYRHIEIADANIQNVHISLQKMMEQYCAQLIFIVLPIDEERPRQKISQEQELKTQILYSEIKKVAETTIGLITQCVKGKNVQEKYANPSFISNLCLKLNAKMGGINNTLMPGEISEFTKHSILIVGADVNHSAIYEDSIAAVVGSMDEHYYRYTATISYQRHENKNKKSLEVILDFKSMIHKILLNFQEMRGNRPQKIIVYRDGVSEGQFKDIQDREIKSIREACDTISYDYKPAITFIVVQKRQHRKFVPEHPSDGAGPMRNVPPGTTVDSTVTHPLNFDFYLYSHLGIKGTSKCCYYTVLHDDNKYGFDAIEKLSYYLCHIYVRCTKSISVPCPIQYAHLAAKRARKHLISYFKNQDSLGLLKGKNNSIKMLNLRREEIIKAISVKDNMTDSQQIDEKSACIGYPPHAKFQVVFWSNFLKTKYLHADRCES
ncbi:protein argonaute-2 [Nephila pilipes]|uniref:Protein argonaute-2 n=1 Tax=Nephila pilipes TaxID=299642 RepID=A0A8X6UJA0_NEPPI|nr:protein argonaute-2 [Nephila pilipes]